ncbi:MAG: DivIVA domain-containing protein, partial [Oscillospiraceae bacterium]
KASFGGYNMAMVDEFLDQLTADYTALYKENATLKAKMKVLADSLEEYRATEKGMRRALLAAQQAADEMVKEAESRKSELIHGAEAEAQARIADLRRQVADEEARLTAAQTSTANFVAQIRETCRRQEEYLDSLSSITAAPPAVDSVDQTAHAIEESVQRLLEQEDEDEEQAAESAPEEASEEPVSLYEELTGRSRRDQERARAFEEAPAEEVSADTSPTRRIDFDNLQFGSNYDLK